ncbi:MAG TPA: hypothetical protein VEM40_02020 [Nitrospirota bacterium]|nr:hypothetical protein [Nitrospirota bacterium]
MHSLKQRILHALESNDLDAVVSLVKNERRSLSILVRISYDKETLAAWRAIKAVGLAAKEIIKTDDGFLREAVRKLLWSLSDESGGIGWSAPELLGEIVSADPKRFSDIIPLIAQVYEIEEEVFRPGVVYALARIAEADPEQIAVYQEIVVKSLADKNPLLNLYGLQLVERLWQPAIRENLWNPEYIGMVMNLIEKITTYKEVEWIYKNEGFISCQVGDMAKKIHKYISQ